MKEQNSQIPSNNNDSGHTLGIVGFILAFVGLSVVGLVLSIIGYKKSKVAGIKNGLALAGIWVNSFFVLLNVIAFVIFPFVVLPSFQSSQRDTVRKNHASLFTAQIVNYQAINRGQMPSESFMESGKFVSTYITMGDDDWTSPSGNPYSIKTSGSPTTDVFVYTIGEDCDGSVSTMSASIKIKLESGLEYCSSN